MTDNLADWTFVFDLDGTLVETAPDLHAALNYTLAAKSLGNVPMEQIRPMIGDGAKALIRKGLSWHQQHSNEAEIDEALWPIFIDHYRNNICRLSHPYDGVIPVLERLSVQGTTLSVCTNKPQQLAEEVLKGLNLDQYFAATVGGDATASKKPDGAHIMDAISKAGGNSKQAIMIGDSQPDERAARDAELPFVFVTFGYGDLSDEPYSSLQVIDHWEDMEPALVNLMHQN